MREASQEEGGVPRLFSGLRIVLFFVLFAAIFGGSIRARDIKEDILRFLIGKSNPSATQMETLDLNGDQVVNVADVISAEKQSPPVVSFTFPTQGISESVGTFNLTIATDLDFKGPVDIEFSGTAAIGTDYTTGALSSPIRIQGPLAQIPLTILNDAQAEPVKMIVVRIKDGVGYTVGDLSVCTLYLMDDDGAGNPAFFVASQSSMTEGSGTAQIQVGFGRAFNGTLKYAVVPASTATSGQDYTALSGSVAVNGSSATIAIPVLQDLEVEGTEQLFLNLEAGTGYQVFTPSSHILNIVDDEETWQGVFQVQDQARLDFQMELHRGADGQTQAFLVSDGNGTFPKGSLPVTLGWTEGTFSAQVAPFDIPKSQTMLDEDFKRGYQLNAANMMPSQYVSSDSIYGLYSEEILAVDRSASYLDRTISGGFLLIRGIQKVKMVEP